MIKRSTLCVNAADIAETVLVPAKYLSGGSIGAQITYGENMSLLIATRQPGYHSKPHKHDAEQLNYVLDGELYVFVDDDGFLARKGDIFRIPRNAVHWSWVQGTRSCVLLETHAPPLVGDPGVIDTAVSLTERNAPDDFVTVKSEWPAAFECTPTEKRVLRRNGTQVVDSAS
jgi:quercetin dioxygenase-like cupin family protein